MAAQTGKLFDVAEQWHPKIQKGMSLTTPGQYNIYIYIASEIFKYIHVGQVSQGDHEIVAWPLSNSTVVLFSRDHGGLRFLALKSHLKSNLLFTL